MEITKELVEQMEAVRDDGRCNMLDRSCVVRVAAEKGFVELASLTPGEYAVLCGYAWEHGYDTEVLDA